MTSKKSQIKYAKSKRMGELTAVSMRGYLDTRMPTLMQQSAIRALSATSSVMSITVRILVASMAGSLLRCRNNAMIPCKSCNCFHIFAGCRHIPIRCSSSHSHNLPNENSTTYRTKSPQITEFCSFFFGELKYKC